MNHAEKADTQGASKPPVPEQSHTLRATLPTRFHDRAFHCEIAQKSNCSMELTKAETHLKALDAGTATRRAARRDGSDEYGKLASQNTRSGWRIFPNSKLLSREYIYFLASGK